jgi:hypothetical protein
VKEYHYIGCCIDNPFGSVEELSEVIDNALEIKKKTFLKHCDVLEDILDLMRRFLNSYRYYRGKYNGQFIYFYENSCIEYFFSKE